VESSEYDDLLEHYNDVLSRKQATAQTLKAIDDETDRRQSLHPQSLGGTAGAGRDNCKRGGGGIQDPSGTGLKST